MNQRSTESNHLTLDKMKHTIELDDLELTALMTHLEGQSEIMNESKIKSLNFR